MSSTPDSDYRPHRPLPSSSPDNAGTRKSLFSILLLWPVGCLLLGLLIWSVTLSKIDDDRAAAEASLIDRATSLSKAYSQQVERTIDQIAYLTLQLQYDWEAAKGDIDLEDRYQRGLYPFPYQLYVTSSVRLNPVWNV
jgi:nitrogen fixation-related uncharacterized protein